MHNYFPIIFVIAINIVLSASFIIAYSLMKNKKEAIGFDRTVSDTVIIKRLLRYAKPYGWYFALILLIMMFSIAYDIISPILLGNIEELVKTEFELSELFSRVFLYASILIVSLTCSYIQTIILQKIGQKIISSIRLDLFDHIQNLSHDQLNHIPVGTLVTRLTNDTGAISVMFTNILVNLVKNMFVIVGVLVAMLILNYGLTVMVLCFVPFIVLYTIIFRKFSRKAHRLVKDGTTDINIFLSENLSGIKVTQVFNQEDKKFREFSEKNEKLKRAKGQQILVFGIFRPVVYLLYISSVLCLFYVSGMAYISGNGFLGCAVGSGTLVTFYMYLNKFFNPIQNLAEQFHRLQSSFASAEKIFLIMDIKPEIVDAEDAIELDSIKGEIEFRHVWFYYKPDRWILKDVSFHVAPGEAIALVGATGSGKSTILSLICHNYEGQKGEILIDGIDIKKIKISSLRRCLGQMLQDVFIFSGTIRSNIVLDRDDITDERINEVCRFVNADSFINKLEKGLDEEVREFGKNFSAGQRQLLSFARTIAHTPSVMILDEATANIDTETEMLIQESLERIKTIGTTITVAHRLSTIRNSDRIYLISHGEILEQGSHKELLELGGEYSRLYSLQSDLSEKRKADNNGPTVRKKHGKIL
ncbi:MAG: ABC transporter ATP-binding protein [Firmicutes bacterium]|nr:ABC transporter ATP-binding protein [Candidatus Colimorpha enterica]